MAERNDIPLSSKIKRSFLILTLAGASCAPLQKLTEGLCSGGFYAEGSLVGHDNQIDGLQLTRKVEVSQLGRRHWEVIVGTTNFVPHDGQMFADGHWETIIATGEEERSGPVPNYSKILAADPPYPASMAACVDKYSNIHIKP